MPPVADYIGRFAPSPSGPLHAGSLIAALASYLDAKANNGLWLLRMEDLDPPRESLKAASNILSALEQLNLFWDGAVLYQSQRHDAYRDALSTLRDHKLIFPCTCSRQAIQASGGIYSGACRSRLENVRGSSALPYSLRCRVCPGSIDFSDLFQGKQSQNLEELSGDFILKRKDGLYAYQLAVVVDDAHQKISHVIRGIDLMPSTGKQIYLQSQLGYATPNYGHIPVIVNKLGQKLSKQHFAPALNLGNPGELILTALKYLNQQPDPALSSCKLEDILSWGIHNWNPAKLIGLQQVREFEP